jgi:AcrR family transcriptional regulator
MGARKNYHHGHLREALLAAAQDLLTRVTPNELSLREVARAAGVSPAAPYHHFPTKQDLFAALASKGFADMDASMGEAQAVAGKSALEQLLACGMGYVIFARRHPATYKLMMQPEYCNPAGEQAQQEGTSPTYVRLTDGVARLFAEEGLGVPTEIDAHMWWATVHGLSAFYVDRTLSPFLPEGEQLNHARAVLTRMAAAFVRKG